MASGSGAKRSLGGADYLALDMNGDGGENGLGMGTTQGGSGYQQSQLMEQQVRAANVFVPFWITYLSHAGQLYPIEINSDRIH